VLLRIAAMVITFVVGLHLGPSVGPNVTSAGSIARLEARVSVDAARIGERAKPRVPVAPLLDRLPPVPPASHLEASPPACRLAIHVEPSDFRSFSDPLPIVKSVPRLERGDPPRS